MGKTAAGARGVIAKNHCDGTHANDAKE